MLTTIPQNTAILIGHKFRYDCRTDGKNINLQWYYRSHQSKDLQRVYTGYNVTQAFVEKLVITNYVDGQMLTSSSDNTSDAGTYICEEPETLHISAAELVILRKCS